MTIAERRNDTEAARTRPGADETTRIRGRLAGLAAERDALEARLAAIEADGSLAVDGGPRTSPVTNRSPAAARIALFRGLFGGRGDVYAKRWENPRTGKNGYAPACANEWRKPVCGKPRIKCGACPNQAFPSVTDETVVDHLRGRHTIGLWPMLADGTCRFVAADFDGAGWRGDAGAFVAACRRRGVPAALERSRSGNGGHAWIFFAEPVPAALAVNCDRKVPICCNRKVPTWGVGSSPQARCWGVGLGVAVGNWLGAATGDESGGDKPVIHSGPAAPKPFLSLPAIMIRPSCGADRSRPAAGSGDPASCMSSPGC